MVMFAALLVWLIALSSPAWVILVMRRIKRKQQQRGFDVLPAAGQGEE